jgi:protocatechuate 3,4-dioxygenase beta subunit
MRPFPDRLTPIRLAEPAIQVITGPDGAFRFHTIVSALYSGRTRHYHVKVQVPGSRLLTTQLYFPIEPANLRDVLFQSELLMRIADAGDDLNGRFDFVSCSASPSSLP